MVYISGRKNKFKRKQKRIKASYEAFFIVNLYNAKNVELC